MVIEKASLEDLPEIMEIYAQARAYMWKNGNPTQWKNGYPGAKLTEENIRGGNCRVCRENGEIIGVFSCFPGPDPTYREICDGKWLNGSPYGVIHRIAVREHRKGVASACFAYALKQYGTVRIDTHENNIPMQRALEKNGFTRCGTIFLANGEPRIAYQK